MSFEVEAALNQCVWGLARIKKYTFPGAPLLLLSVSETNLALICKCQKISAGGAAQTGGSGQVNFQCKF